MSGYTAAPGGVRGVAPPSAGGPAAGDGVLLVARSLVVRYPGTDPSARPALALDELTLAPGRSVALVGESGSGKTTALRALLGVVRPAAGTVEFGGVPVQRLGGTAMRAFRRAVQPIQQDTDGALDPRQSVGSAIAEGYRAGGGSRSATSAVVARLLDEVGLPAAIARRHPHEVSGGQRQRAVIARALAVEPRLLLLDEPTSGLDATVQVRILELIERLRAERSLGLLLVSHNLGVVVRLCSETVVLYRGEVVERGDTRALLDVPRHPYTAALRRSVPEIGVPFRAPLIPAIDSASIDTATGCRFASRCPHALVDPCAAPQVLAPVEGDPGRLVRCARAPELGPLDPLA
ncbi:MAG: oligopeptide/dipeptide transporter, ATPase subunit [Chloroflexi bacterium]|nr:oligopeptide/dipeptide transporter, ATPase subunit [Chloroflexota bacterium]